MAGVWCPHECMRACVGGPVVVRREPLAAPLLNGTLRACNQQLRRRKRMRHTSVRTISTTEQQQLGIITNQMKQIRQEGRQSFCI